MRIVRIEVRVEVRIEVFVDRCGQPSPNASDDGYTWFGTCTKKQVRAYWHRLAHADEPVDKAGFQNLVAAYTSALRSRLYG
ncbi:MAG: hypothetical protein HC800_20870 [Phormidesmis sp. RL_2_1]|nr:hypothetical protein [Phormidesmis sp. RL_2_1]